MYWIRFVWTITVSRLRYNKASEISEDELKELEDKVQKLTDKYIDKVDKAVEEKTKEILTV